MSNDLGGLRSRVGQPTPVGRRILPKPAHPAPERPASTTEKAAPTSELTAPAAEATSPAAPAPPKAAAPPPSGTIARSVQLDDAAEDFLDRVRSAGRRSRVDANRSAVVRLALRQLADRLSPEQIAVMLRDSQTTGSNTAGRRIV